MISQREHTGAVIAKLESLGLTVGDGEKPEGATVPYCVVYPIPGGGLSGTIDDPNEDGELVYQVTCVGETREQAEWAVDKTLGLLEGISVAGRYIARVLVDSMPGIRREDEPSTTLFIATPRFRVMTTPE